VSTRRFIPTNPNNKGPFLSFPLLSDHLPDQFFEETEEYRGDLPEKLGRLCFGPQPDGRMT
jgi:hypothetical protein